MDEYLHKIREINDEIRTLQRKIHDLEESKAKMNIEISSPRWMTREQVAEHIGRSVSAIDKLIAKSRKDPAAFPARKRNGLWLFSDIDDWLNGIR